MSSIKTKVAIVFGGRSPEHQISLLSAQNVYKSLDKDKYEPILLGIDKRGIWHYNEDSIALLHEGDADNISMAAPDNPVLISQNTNEHKVLTQKGNKTISDIDVLFPVLHGTFGEDGSIQGLAKLANLPCVGCGILGSAVGMDKDIMKHVLRSLDIAVAKWVTIRKQTESEDYKKITALLGNELFIKPANLGSSVGVAYVENEAQFHKAVENGLKYDHKVIIEEKIIGREIECAILGNANPEASIPGEVVPRGGFYSYENKYLDEKGAELHIPAILNEKQKTKVQELAIRTFINLECRGMTRVDMFMTEDEKLIINEVNTIPGFTNISMYPKLWEITGLSQTALISRLIELAQEEHRSLNKLQLT